MLNLNGIQIEKAFDLLKRELTIDKVMSYFDPTKETTMIVDASPVGRFLTIKIPKPPQE